MKSAQNAAAQEVARAMICKKYGLKEISRAEALRAGFKSGGELNAEVQQLVSTGAALPSREEYTKHFRRLCELHGVVFEGGVEGFLAGAWKLRDQMGREPEMN